MQVAAPHSAVAELEVVRRRSRIMKFQSLLPTLAFCICGLLAGCSRSPSGYDWIVEGNGGQHRDSISDPAKYAEFAAKWVRNWRSSLAFFTSELDSQDPKHVKAGILCLTNLAAAVEQLEPPQMSQSDKSDFSREFPVAKLKQRLTEHPEYDEWISFIRHTKFGPEFPESQAQQTK